MIEAIFNILKISVMVAVAATFLIAIHTICNFIITLLFGNVVGEVLAVISNCLPFDAGAVFSAIFVSIQAIFAFLIAKKIFDLTSWSVSSV